MNRVNALAVMLALAATTHPDAPRPKHNGHKPGEADDIDGLQVYQHSRDALDPRELRRVRHQLRDLLHRKPLNPDALIGGAVDWSPWLVQVELAPNRFLLILATPEQREGAPRPEAHLCVRAVEIVPGEDGQPFEAVRLPSWPEMVLARALAYDDEAEVLQIIPPASMLTGEVLHLFGPVRS